MLILVICWFSRSSGKKHKGKKKKKNERKTVMATADDENKMRKSSKEISVFFSSTRTHRREILSVCVFAHSRWSRNWCVVRCVPPCPAIRAHTFVPFAHFASPHIIIYCYIRANVWFIRDYGGRPILVQICDSKREIRRRMMKMKEKISPRIAYTIENVQTGRIVWMFSLTSNRVESLLFYFWF